jgi:hypothetical protein
VLPGAEQFLRDRDLLNQFVEYVYNYWRHFARVIVCDSEGNRFDRRPYQTFNRTVETLTNVVRSTYRDLQENLSGNHPRIYRQVPAGAEIATIALPREIPYPTPLYKSLNEIAVIRQILIYPPLIFNPPMNKRNGTFEQVDQNPLEGLELKKENWLCYPAKVGPLLIMVYFSLKFAELGFSLCNLFELAEEKDIQRKPDAAFLFGVPEDEFPELGKGKTVFFDDQKNDMLMAAIPDSDAFGYFGYLKKMILTLHNSLVMKAGNMPFHGAMVKILLHGNKEATILMMGDTGAGKSETLESFRVLGEKQIRDLKIIADDMGSIELDSEGNAIGYGTEIGAFLRLDDLQPGYAYGHLDRSIIMNPSQVNARIVFPVTSFETIIHGYKIDYILYANNYEEIDNDHPVIERFNNAEWALDVFRNGAVMSKGTTTSTGLVHSYFANIFGPPEYRDIHEKIVEKHFASFFKTGIFVGQMRTRLGIQGYETSGPREAATELLKIIGVTE